MRLDKLRKEIDLVDKRIVYCLVKKKSFHKLVDKRIKIGLKIAKVKLADDNSLRNLNKQKIINKIRNKKRENQILRNVCFLAMKNGLDNNKVERLFRKIILKTIEAEVKFILSK